MARVEGGGTKVLRGVWIAVIGVAALVLVAVFWRRIVDAFVSAGDFVGDRFPSDSGQATAVIVYLVLAAIMGVIFSRAGHFTAYGIVVALLPLLWFLFWEGFPLLGLDPSWTDAIGLQHMEPSQVILFAVLADVLMTIIFVPLEWREKIKRRR